MTIDLYLAAIETFAIAILIGALVGIEREKRHDAETDIGGIRTFVMMAMLGARTVVFATDYAKLLTGETVYVDGGYIVHG
jgi:uncharacterized membrane protein YhiD involved in acid resistance